MRQNIKNALRGAAKQLRPSTEGAERNKHATLGPTVLKYIRTPRPVPGAAFADYGTF
ncbi:Uncharacterised protein [Burkholderia pseudomallei]|nr:Uncharacterised protein [Burkholderia pseudomallei]